MSTNSLSNLVKREKALLDRSRKLMRYRQINWQVETRYRIYQAFERLANETRKQDFLFDLHVSELEHPCESVIQISARPILTGAIKRTTTFNDEFEELVSDKPVLEDGGVLVASQSVSGHVAFIVHPRKSERIKPSEEQIILYVSLDPTEVTAGLISKVFRRYLLYVRSTSIFGIHDSLSLGEMATLVLMKIGDIRYQYELSRSLMRMKNEWAKIVVAAVLAWAFGFLAGSGK
nr:hypothetical protein [uncultured Rhodoferax sp.]